MDYGGSGNNNYPFNEAILLAFASYVHQHLHSPYMAYLLNACFEFFVKLKKAYRVIILPFLGKSVQ